MKSLLTLWTGSMALWSATIAAAQAPTAPTTQLEAMKKLDFMIGNWKGGGMFEFGPGQRRAFSGTETVTSKQDGLVLFIEGLHKAKTPGSDAEIVVHDALAFIYYDEKAKIYHFQTHLGTGMHQDAEARAVEGGLQWGFKDVRGFSVRFTIKPPDKDTWHEVGEMSQDGQTWQKFFEMTLKRQK